MGRAACGRAPVGYRWGMSTRLTGRGPRATTRLDLPTIHLAAHHPDRVVREMVRARRWVRVMRGAYVDADWIYPEGVPVEDATKVERVARRESFAVQRRRTLARIVAQATAGGDDQPVFTHTSAAFVWGLPLWRPSGSIHVLARSSRPRHAAPGVVGHVMAVAPEHVVTFQGLRVTSLERTMMDVARSYPAADALVIADGALRIGVDRDVVNEIAARSAGFRGIARARELIGYADPGAESPWESFTRLHALAAGLPPPRLQVEIATHRGTYRADMGWTEWRRLLEFDGGVKYRELANGDPAAVLLEEKRRQDAITEERWGFLRLTSPDFRDRDLLHQRLRSFVPEESRATLTPRPHLLLPHPRR